MNRRGFTLLELLISVAVSSVVMAAIGIFFSSSFNFTIVSSRNNEIQRESRMALDIMVRDIRSAGYGVIEPLTGGNHVAASAFPIITPGNNVDPDPEGNANSLDTLEVSGGYQFVGDLNLPAADNATQLSILPLAGTKPTNPTIVGKTITLDGFYTGSVTAVSGPVAGIYILTLATPLNRAYTTSSSVSVLQKVKYRVALSGTEPALWRNDGVSDQVIASGIEDLQVGYLLNDGTVVDNPVGATSPIRGVRVSLLARALDPETTATISTRPALEDHAAAISADRYHRRRITRTVEIRNLGL